MTSDEKSTCPGESIRLIRYGIAPDLASSGCVVTAALSPAAYAAAYAAAYSAILSSTVFPDPVRGSY